MHIILSDRYQDISLSQVSSCALMILIPSANISFTFAVARADAA